jgi:CheY-like chemotaxis protein
LNKEISNGHALKIMLVDDDDIASFIYRKVIETAGLSADQITTFLRGTEALDHLKNNINNDIEFPDLILLDINMPVMDGWEFLDEYSEKISPKLNKRVVVTMLSSSLYQKDIDKAYSYPQVNDYVSKPLTCETLKALLGKHFVNN